ncbi:hypothetical protein [Paraburkholderia sp. GAS334]|uniref:hypothetical protein n=1 Tax=Paraburkholderia sp. GAS334 TaxID=3035131 RepID=UPI003D2283F1
MPTRYLVCRWVRHAVVAVPGNAAATWVCPFIPPDETRYIALPDNKLDDLASQIRPVAGDGATPDRIEVTGAAINGIAAIIVNVIDRALIPCTRGTVHLPLKPRSKTHDRHHRYSQKRKLNFPQTHRCSGFSFDQMDAASRLASPQRAR